MSLASTIKHNLEKRRKSCCIYPHFYSFFLHDIPRFFLSVSRMFFSHTFRVGLKTFPYSSENIWFSFLKDISLHIGLSHFLSAPKKWYAAFLWVPWFLMKTLLSFCDMNVRSFLTLPQASDSLLTFSSVFFLLFILGNFHCCLQVYWLFPLLPLLCCWAYHWITVYCIFQFWNFHGSVFCFFVHLFKVCSRLLFKAFLWWPL